LYKTLHEIFPPGTKILEEFQLPLSFLHTGLLMTFDVYVPSLNLIFEYHGIQHYYDHYMFGAVKFLHEKDRQRRVACIYHSITYFEVPYWWQHDKESIIALVYKARPDIVPHALGIPFQYPTQQNHNQIKVIKHL